MLQGADIIFDAERMKYPHTGIYHYCKQLGQALLRQQHEHSHKLGFYLPASANNIFASSVFKITQHSLHKFFMPSMSRYKVWHSTYQGTHYFPQTNKTKIAFTIHDLNFLYEKKTLPKQKKYLGILQKKIQRADALIAISHFVKNEIESHLNTGGKAIKVIHNGCNISNDVIPSAPSGFVDFPFIFAIGAITPKKNFHILPASIMNNDLHLVIAGVVQDKEYFSKMMNEAKRYGVEKKIHYTGAVSEPEKYWLMQNCSLFCFPSLAEGFGLPVIEAMRFGKPVLLSKATSLPEIGGSLAFYLDDVDPQHVSDMTNHALSNVSGELSQKIIEWSYQFDWNRAAQEYWGVYESLCKI